MSPGERELRRMSFVGPLLRFMCSKDNSVCAESCKSSVSRSSLPFAVYTFSKSIESGAIRDQKSFR